MCHRVRSIKTIRRKECNDIIDSLLYKKKCSQRYQSHSFIYMYAWNQVNRSFVVQQINFVTACYICIKKVSIVLTIVADNSNEKENQ